MPLMYAIVIKTGHILIVCDAQEQRKVLIHELSTCVDPVRARKILAELNDLARAERLVGFSRHSEEDQDSFQLAAIYSDDWVKGVGLNGPYWVRMFWIC